jgi:hypothetical protein
MKRLAIFAIFALLLASAGFAQMVPTSKIEGRVIDAQLAPLPGVSVEATSPKLVGKATAVTDADGRFRLFSLPSGVYDVVFALQGFKTLKREGIIVQLSQTITLNVTLEQASIEEQVTVVGMSPLIDVKSTIKSQTMTKEVFMSLPRSRSFDGLISTVPGVQYDNRTGGLSVDGATGTENMWYMDGADVSQVHLGTLAQGAVMELVEEVKVTASGYNAEFGGSMGGVVNVITRSGGNAFHGDIMAYYNDNTRLMQGYAREYFRWNPANSNIAEYVNDDSLYWGNGNNRDDYKRYEGVFNLGGYIVKDRLWFFGSFNPVYYRTYGFRFFNSDLLPLPNPQVLPQYRFYNKNLVFNGSIKLTAAPIRGLRLGLSAVNNWSSYRGAIPSILGSSSKNYAYNNEGFDYPNWSAAFLADYTISNNFLASLRAGYHLTNQNNQQIANRFTTISFDQSNSMFSTDPFFVTNPSLIRLGGAVNWSGSRTVFDHYKLEKYSSNLDLTYYMNLGGEHAWKAGVQLVRDGEDVFNAAVAPMVDIGWDQPCTELEAYGVPPTRGTYGYYRIRSSWRQAYGWAWKIHRNNWALYLQDSWTIKGKWTVNAGLRTESEYIPTFNPNVEAQYQKPIKFGFGDKLAPRVGLVYDVFGDSSLKLFASFGIYNDVMKLYMAEGAFGGFKWQTDYYTLDNPNWSLIGANWATTGLGTPEGGPTQPAAVDQAAGGTYLGTLDWRLPSFDTLQPNLKPVAQREISFGAEKKLTEDISVSARGIWKHLLRTIEDIGILTPAGEQYYEGNPGSPWIVDLFNRLQTSDVLGPLPSGMTYWPQPKAIRNYYGLNLELIKRFSHNWQGGINYTLSLTKGNYGGLSSTDEFGRNSPNVERSFDLWFMMYEMDGTAVNGTLPQDRTHYIKAYGSYSFPIGLTIGVAAYGRSGNPISERVNFNNSYIYPYGYGNLGRLPFTAWADIYAEWAVKIAGKTFALNAQINNVTNTKTWQNARYIPTRNTMSIPDALLLDHTAIDPNTTLVDSLGHTYYWVNRMAFYRPDISYIETSTAQATTQKGYDGRFGTWTVRFGFRFTF